MGNFVFASEETKMLEDQSHKWINSISWYICHRDCPLMDSMCITLRKYEGKNCCFDIPIWSVVPIFLWSHADLHITDTIHQINIVEYCVSIKFSTQSYAWYSAHLQNLFHTTRSNIFFLVTTSLTLWWMNDDQLYSIWEEKKSFPFYKGIVTFIKKPFIGWCKNQYKFIDL